MTLPKPLRKPGIIAKLDYSLSEAESLGAMIFDSYKSDGANPIFVAQRAENILSHARECFDHLAKDLVESILLAIAPQSYVKKFQAGKLRAYFPFYIGQLSNQRTNAFSESKKLHPELYHRLSEFVLAMDANQTMIGTSRPVRYLRMMCEMVNDKKHSQILEYKKAENEYLFVDGGDESIVFLDKNFRNTPDMPQIALPIGGVPKLISAYRFPYNNLDVDYFCKTVVWLTQMVIDNFYNEFFEPAEPCYKPEAPPIVTYLSKEEADAQGITQRTQPINI